MRFSNLEGPTFHFFFSQAAIQATNKLTEGGIFFKRSHVYVLLKLVGGGVER